MKELQVQDKLPSNNKVELNVKKRQEIEYVLNGSIKPKFGHKIYEVNTNTGEVNLAKYKSDTVVFNHLSKMPAEKLIVNQDCIYISALNKENAKKKFLKDSNQNSYFGKKPILDINMLKS